MRILLPGIDQAHAAALEISGVARGQYGSAGAGDGGDLGIELGDWTALGAVSGGYFWKSAGGLLVERENASGKILSEHNLSFGSQTVAPLTPGKDFDSVKNLRHGHGGGEEFG